MFEFFDISIFHGSRNEYTALSYLDRSRRIVGPNSSLKAFQRWNSFATDLWKTRHLTLFLQYNNIPLTTPDFIVGDLKNEYTF